MENKEYNWWNDPKNKEAVDKMSWWEHIENKTTIEIPVSIIHDGNYWTIGTNDDTKKLIGESLSSGCASAETKEEAISNFFVLLKMASEYNDKCRRKYQRWVPFRKGDWNHIGGKWFVIFGVHFSFRRGKGMKGGRYIPFTKLNISIRSQWKY